MREPLGLSLAAGALIGFGGSGAALAGPWGDLDVNQTPLSWMQNCVIYTTKDVQATGTFRVFAGPNESSTYRNDVCSIGSVTVGGSEATSLIPQEAPLQVDVAVAAPRVELGQQSGTSECVYDMGAGGGLIPASNAQTVCPVQRNVDLSGMPVDLDSVVPFPDKDPQDFDGLPERVVGVGETLSLTPGTYGRVVLRLNSTLNLTKPGDYFFKSIRTHSSSTRAFIRPRAEGVNLYVDEYLLLGHQTSVNGQVQPGDDEVFRQFKIFVNGGDGWEVEGWAGVRTGYVFRGDAVFNACYVYSPNATQTWRGISKNGAYRTQAFAKAYALSDALRVVMAHPQDPGCYNGPVPQVRCDSKQLPETIGDEQIIRATVKLSNAGTQTAQGVTVADTMDDPELAFVAGSAEYEGTTPTATGGPVTGGQRKWTFSPLDVPSGESILSYDIDVGDLPVGEEACNTVTVSQSQGGDVSTCRACVKRADVIPAAQCDGKLINGLSDETIDTPSKTVDVEVFVSNPTAATASPVVIVDTMDDKMAYVGGTGRIGGPDGVRIEPVEDPAANSWTFTVPSLGPGESLVLTYQATVTNLDINETVRNQVTVTPDGTNFRSRANAVTRQAAPGVPCSATVTRRPGPVPIPAMGLFGMSFLALALAVLGARHRARNTRA